MSQSRALSGPLSFGLSKSIARPEGAGRWSPLALFVGGTTKGAWYDPSDLTSMFQNSNGTTAVAVGDPVGYIADKSGNGYHAIQATAGLRPVLRQDAQGRYYLETDGSDDILVASFTAVTTDRAMMVLAAQIDTTGSTGSDQMFACGNSINGNPLLYLGRTSTDVSAAWRATSGASVTYVRAITTAADGRHVFSVVPRDASTDLRMDSVSLGSQAGTPASSSFDRIGIGALMRTTAANWAPGRFYGGVVVFRAATASELSNTETYLSQLGLNP